MGNAFALTPVSLDERSGAPLGLHASYLKEQDSALDLTQAMSAYREGKFVACDTPILTFGMGSRPVWIAFEVKNDTVAQQLRRLDVETSWLDKLDVYFLTDDKTVASYELGDSKPFSLRPIKRRFFEIDHIFPVGSSRVLMRIETSDPIVVPIFLRTVDESLSAEVWQNYSYGVLYGFLLGLMAFNLMLYATLKSKNYLFYSAYLASYLLLNIVYTGHGFTWLWPEQTWFQYMFPPFSMVMYALGGLLFAAQFLNTRVNFPRWHKSIIWLSFLVVVSLVILPIMGLKSAQMAMAFTFVFVFCAIMPVLGVISLRSGYMPARYFLYGASVAMTGAFFTDLSVAGVLPFNELTYRASELGMMVDAILFSLALAYQYRIIQEEKVRAEGLARIDPLTGLCNRRAFYEITKTYWNSAIRNDRDATVVMLDVDHFKHVNDTYGHDNGDKVLIAIASVLTQSARESDVVARWGGEEFILFLPETSCAEAIILAERLRVSISQLRVDYQGGCISFTSSFGVAQRTDAFTTIDELIVLADKLLYLSKKEGRNIVSSNL
jgi:diguanylate cyclase (GGDEF)-like protein